MVAVGGGVMGDLAGFCAAFFNTALFMGFLVLLFGNTEYMTELMNGKNLTESLSLVRDIVFETARSFSKYAVIKVTKLSVVVSCEMAADTAIMFGIANGLVSSAIALCESFRIFIIKDGAICVYQDYISGKSKLSLDISLSIRVYHILLCLLPTLKAFINKNNIKSSQKEKKS